MKVVCSEILVILLSPSSLSFETKTRLALEMKFIFVLSSLVISIFFLDLKFFIVVHLFKIISVFENLQKDGQYSTHFKSMNQTLDHIYTYFPKIIIFLAMF